MNSMVDLSIAMLVITRGYAMINHYEPLLIIINHSYAMLCHVMPCCAMLCHGDWDGMFVDIFGYLGGFQSKVSTERWRRDGLEIVEVPSIGSAGCLLGLGLPAG